MISFCFGFIAVGMGVMGLFVIFSSIVSEKDDRVQQAFRDGFAAGVYKNENRVDHMQSKTTKELSKK